MNVAFEFFNDFALRFQRELNQIELKLNWNDLTTRTELPKHTLKYNCVYLCLSLTHCLTSSAVHYFTHTRTHIHARERGETKENKRKQTSAEAHRLQMIGNATKIAKETCSVFCLDFNNIFLKFTFCCCIHSVSCTFVLCTPTKIDYTLRLSFAFFVCLFSFFIILLRGPRSMLSLAVLLREWT